MSVVSLLLSVLIAPFNICSVINKGISSSISPLKWAFSAAVSRESLQEKEASCSFQHGLRGESLWTSVGTAPAQVLNPTSLPPSSLGLMIIFFSASQRENRSPSMACLQRPEAQRVTHWVSPYSWTLTPGIGGHRAATSSASSHCSYILRALCPHQHPDAHCRPTPLIALPCLLSKLLCCLVGCTIPSPMRPESFLSLSFLECSPSALGYHVDFLVSYSYSFIIVNIFFY